MNFFEYLFCRLYWWNTKIVKEKEMPVYYSIMGISVFHGFSVIPIFGILYVLIFDSFYIKDTAIGLDPFLIQIKPFLFDFTSGPGFGEYYSIFLKYLLF